MRISRVDDAKKPSVVADFTCCTAIGKAQIMQLSLPDLRPET
jgi:hypothetical protein